MPYLRVGMHIRNLEIMGRMDKDKQDSEDAKQKIKAKQDARLKGAGVR